MRRVPLSMTADIGTVNTFPLPPTGNSTSANIAGLSNWRGLSISSRTETVRVSGFSVG